MEPDDLDRLMVTTFELGEQHGRLQEECSRERSRAATAESVVEILSAENEALKGKTDWNVLSAEQKELALQHFIKCFEKSTKIELTDDQQERIKERMNND